MQSMGSNDMKFSDILDQIGQTDKNTYHTYGFWYDVWFEKIRKDATDVMEIGVCAFGGGCVLSLASYFPNATIWGIDIDCGPCTDAVKGHPRINLISADAYCPEFTERLDVQFDLIIDDGSHEIADQLHLLQLLRPYIKDNGFYVIEDCCTVHWLPRLPTIRSIQLQQTIVDMSTERTYDNTLIRFDPV